MLWDRTRLRLLPKTTNNELKIADDDGKTLPEFNDNYSDTITFCDNEQDETVRLEQQTRIKMIEKRNSNVDKTFINFV